jgi:hypothetical protein
LATLGEQICPNPEAFKAWSQNLGHAHVLTTFTSYGAVALSRQMEILGGLTAASLGGPSVLGRTPIVTLDPDQMNQLIQHFEAAAGRKQVIP